MISIIGSILVWILIAVGGIGAVICAVIGFLVLVNFPSKFR